MKILVYPHDLNIGGSQLNAIDLGSALRDLGHEVCFFGRPGLLVRQIESDGLEFIESPPPRKRPSLRVSLALRDIAKKRKIDLIHGYEWPPALEATLASRIGAPSVPFATVLSMSIPPFIPSRIWLTVGTDEIAAFEKAKGRQRLATIEPPVDTAANAPGQGGNTADFLRRARLDLGDDCIRIVVVTRFAYELKLEGVLSAIEAIALLAERLQTRLQLILVGDGPARDQVARASQAVNERLGRRAIVMVGALADPRPAYQCADIMLGMGGSALRALAFRKPLVVQGENGFWKLLTETTLDQFLWHGWYGYGDGTQGSAARLAEILHSLISDSEKRAELGAFGRRIVEDRFSLSRLALALEKTYKRAVAEPVPTAQSIRSDITSLMRYSSYYLTKRVKRALGRNLQDDFNAKPVAALAKTGLDER